MAILDLLRALIFVNGWTYCGPYADPPPAPTGFITETREDSFLGLVTHYRFVPEQEAK